jgi:uncharacterized protein (TIGR01244 family)
MMNCQIGAPGEVAAQIRNPEVLARVRQFDTGLAVAGELSHADVNAIATAGYRMVLDLRANGESGLGGLCPEAEQTLVQQLGLEYLQVPVLVGAYNDAAVAQVRRILRERTGPALLHSSHGGRALALGLIHLACDHGATLGECYARAGAMGVDWARTPTLLTFWIDYTLRSGRVTGAPGSPLGLGA